MAARQRAQPAAQLHRAARRSASSTGVVVFAAGWRNYYAVVCFSLAAFVLATIFMEFYRGTRARQALMGEPAPRALANLVGKNRRRYGGYVIHVGIVMAFVGVAASSAFRLEEQETIHKGDVGRRSAPSRSRTRTSTSPTAPHYSSMLAEIEVQKNGAPVGDDVSGEALLQEAAATDDRGRACAARCIEDLYLVLGSYDEASGLDDA